MPISPLDHFRSGELTVGVVGLGYVGLPLSVQIARSGLRVLGFDVESETVNGINAGASHIEDVTEEELSGVLATGRLEATTDMARLAECDAISISVPTPLSKTQDPGRLLRDRCIGGRCGRRCDPGSSSFWSRRRIRGRPERCSFPRWSLPGLPWARTSSFASRPSVWTQEIRCGKPRTLRR